MRALADAERLRRFFRELSRATDEETAIYVTGGATAVLIGWRESTLDADIVMEPERDALFRALPALKDALQINVELASPAHFIPELPGWRDRCRFIVREGAVSYYHYDPYAQALAKIERSHGKDLADVRELIGRGLVTPARLRELFEAIRPVLHRHPAINPDTFAARVEAVLGGGGA